MRHRFAHRAEADIVSILDETLRAFGARQVRVYADPIDRAVALLAAEPRRPSAQARPELGPGVRSFHVALASGRRAGALHVRYYTIAHLTETTT